METRWGKRCGRYEIIAEVGRGAMGVVYKARDPKIDRFVAVKTISLSGQSPEETRAYRERFFHEAQAAGRLLHPGIVTIFDTGEDPESRVAFIVMEYIAGQSLDRLLSGTTKKLPLNTALQLTQELAEALDHAHAQGVVHRDMKPANILVTHEGHAKIADFGIAKLNLAHLTLPSQALGTPAYMSPEQLEGEAVDGRSDLFSLGAILYRMVTGYGPFQGNSAATVCFKVANRDPLRATSFNCDLPPELDALIARAMAKDPAQRYQRGLEFALDLRELQERLQAISKDTNGALRFSRGGEVAFRSGRDSTSGGASANFGVAGLFRTSTQVARQMSSFTRRQVFSWWRRPIVPMGLAFSVATVILSSFVYRQGHAFRGSGPIATPVAVALGAEPPPGFNRAQSTAHSAEKTSDSRAFSKLSANSTLDINIEHHFSAADLSLWIDDKLTYDHVLHGQAKRSWNPFRGSVRETETVQLAAGEHSLRVRVRSAPDKYEQSATILGTFAKGHPKILQINFEKHGKEMRMAFR
jgi:serine/threonine protein kinase